MSLSRAFLNLVAFPLRLGRRHYPQVHTKAPRILVIRRNRLGDMIYTLPLVHALRTQFPQAHLAVACDPPGAPIARACAVVDNVVVLASGWNPWQAALKNSARLQDYDWVIAVKGGFDRRLAVLTRLTNAAVRIGFEDSSSSSFYTDPVPLPDRPHEEHQIETVLRLLAPLGIEPPVFNPNALRLRIPEISANFASYVLASPPFAGRAGFALINISCNRPVKFAMEDYAALIRRLVADTPLAVGIVGAPQDQAAIRSLAASFPADRVAPVATPGPLDLAALLERAALFITPEGGAAHLSTATQTPTLVLWSGHFGKWRPRGGKHVLVEAAADEPRISLERIWSALQSML